MQTEQETIGRAIHKLVTKNPGMSASKAADLYFAKQYVLDKNGDSVAVNGSSRAA